MTQRSRDDTTDRTTDERGMVTAEAAAVLPLVSLLALALVWMISVGITQVQVVDAARDAARTLARGGDAQAAVLAARRTAGAGATVEITHVAGLVSVTVTEPANAPGWLLGSLPTVTVRGQSRVEDEGDPGGS